MGFKQLFKTASEKNCFTRIFVAFYGWGARGIGHADGLDWAPNSVGAR
jgi:hypothetical protein